MSNVLEATGVTVQFGGLTACNSIDFVIPKESIVALIGPNGAGKTTVVNLVTGLLPPSSGGIEFDGHSVVGLPSHRITQHGIARTFQKIGRAHV